MSARKRRLLHRLVLGILLVAYRFKAELKYLIRADLPHIVQAYSATKWETKEWWFDAHLEIHPTSMTSAWVGCYCELWILLSFFLCACCCCALVWYVAKLLAVPLLCSSYQHDVLTYHTKMVTSEPSIEEQLLYWITVFQKGRQPGLLRVTAGCFEPKSLDKPFFPQPNYASV